MRQPDEALKRGLAEALRLHAEGRYGDALQLMAAHGVLKTASGQSLAGDIHLKQGNPREALKAFDNAVRLAPSAAEPYANRGAALLELGRLDEALAAEDRALRLRPQYGTAHFNRGNVLRAMARYEDALTAYARAIRVRPFAGAHLNRGMAFGALRRQREALEEFGRALRLEPKLTAAHLGRAISFRDLGQYGDAFAALDAALALNPEDDDAIHFRPALLNDTERHAEALAAADALIAGSANDVRGWTEKARALLKLRRLPEAAAAIDTVIRLNPQDPIAHVTRGAVMAELGREQECIAAIEEARRLGASEKSYLPTLALANMALGKYAAADADFVRALTVDPDDFQTHINRSFLHFMTGDWQGGWDDFEWRLKQYEHPSKTFAKFAPKWAGEPLAGKRIAVFAEQGFGDTLQFVRFLPRLLSQGAAVTLVPQGGLAALLADNFPAVEVLPAIGLRQDFDYQISLMSLPSVFRDSLETLPAAPYLTADPARVEKWRTRIGDDALRVGIIWQGAKKYTRDATRSIPLARYAPLAAVPGVRLFSVQAQIGLEQLDHLPEGMKVTRLGEELENNPDGFREMAAIMANLDLLVMSDTGPTHLAGALGRPVWLALSHGPDWRWMREREDTPWYPTMRLFRQAAPGDWDGVFQRIAAELRPLAEPKK
jgi:tetratricopeptide (TPR) repeat protein